MSEEGIKELRQRMLLLETAHAAAGMGHFVFDARTETFEFSAWIRENLGLNDIPIPLDWLPEIIAESDREWVTAKVNAALEARDEFEFEAKVVASNGKLHTQNVSGIAAFQDPKSREEFIGFFGIIRDVTEEKAARAELRKMRDAAQEQLDARNNLLAVVSHEIRTPLGGIIGIIDQLKREHSALERERALRLIEDSCEALLGTLDGVLQKTRLEMEPGQLSQEAFSPYAVAKRVAELFRPLARRKGLGMSVVGTTDAKAIGDAARLQQILANLVSNAVKFTQSGEVTISVQEADNSDLWHFEVADTGSGMDAKRASEVFEAFGASERDTLGRNVGSGLGLSITKDLVEAMGGAIEVKSKRGTGSTFAFSVPFARFAEAKREIAPYSNVHIAMLVERASVRIQVEAALDGVAANLEEAKAIGNKTWSDRLIPILVVDAGLLREIPKAAIEAEGLKIVVIETISDFELQPELQERTVRVAPRDLSNRLPAIVEEALHGLA